MIAVLVNLAYLALWAVRKHLEYWVASGVPKDMILDMWKIAPTGECLSIVLAIFSLMHWCTELRERKQEAKEAKEMAVEKA